MNVHRALVLNVEQAVQVLGSNEETGAESVFLTQVIDRKSVAANLVVFIIFLHLLPVYLSLLDIVISLQIYNSRDPVVLHF